MTAGFATEPAAMVMASSFELWCERNDLGPDDAWAWERYRLLVGEAEGVSTRPR